MKSVTENVLTYTKKEYQATADTAWLDARTVGMYGMRMPNQVGGSKQSNYPIGTQTGKKHVLL